MNGTIANITAEQITKTLTIEVNAERPTSLQIAVPRQVLDVKINPEDPNSADLDFSKSYALNYDFASFW